MRSFDYVIVGSGIAGLYAALMAREQGTVLVLTKGSIDECNTKYAQGGIAAAVGPDDSADLHFEDTMEAGANPHLGGRRPHRGPGAVRRPLR